LSPHEETRRQFNGGYSGTAKDSQDTLEFSGLTGVHPMIEKYPLSRVAEAYEQMHSGNVRFRVVLTMGAGDSNKPFDSTWNEGARITSRVAFQNPTVAS
jgi:hypothetical protein